MAASGLFLSLPRPQPDNGDWLLCLVIWVVPLLGLPITSITGRFMPLLTFALLIRVLWHAGAVQRYALPAPRPNTPARG